MVATVVSVETSLTKVMAEMRRSVVHKGFRNSKRKTISGSWIKEYPSILHE